MKPTLRLLLLLPTSVLLATTPFADEVFIRNAGSISGRIVEETPTAVTVDIGGGVISVPMSHVARITRAPTDLDEYEMRIDRLAPHDLQGWRELARWASRRGMDGPAERAFGMVLALDPDDPDARAALGFARLDGAWVPREEALRARGLFKHEGTWMTPEEVRMRRDAAAAEQAGREAERQARAAELEKLKEEVRAAYAAEAARDEAWRAEGAAWFYSQVYGCGYGYRYGDGYEYGYRLGDCRPSWRFR